MCTKSIYAADRQINFNGKIHSACAKCKDCGSSLTASDAFRVKEYGSEKMIMVCKTHNAERLKNKSEWRAPTVEKIDSIMTPGMCACMLYTYAVTLLYTILTPQSPIIHSHGESARSCQGKETQSPEGC